MVPKVILPESCARIRALNDPTRKMSKSQSETRGHAVRLTDDHDEIRRTFRRAVTDTGRKIVFSTAPEKAGVNNMLEIHELMTGESRSEIEAYFDGQGYATLKNEVAEVVIENLRPIRERYHELISARAELDAILADGARRARAVADPKIELVKRKVGFFPPGGRE